MRNKAFPWLCVSLAVAAAASAAEAPPPAEGVAFYEKAIRPLLAEHCYQCHSAQAKRLRGGLRRVALIAVLG
jgi:hypothetical protein